MADEFDNNPLGNPGAGSTPGPQPSFAQFFQQYQQQNPVKSDPFENQNFSAQQVDRYKKSDIYSPWIDPFADNETMAAQAQSGWDALWNGTKGSWDGIKDGFVSSALVLPRLVGSIFSSGVDGMMDDEYGMRLSEIEQQQNQNENPIYMTEAERDDIFSLKAAGEMMQNAGYTIGTFAELAVETVAVEFLAGAFTAATGGSGAGALAATTAVEAGRWGRFMNNLRKAGTATGEALRYGTKTAEIAAQDALRARTVARQAEIISEMGKLRDVQFGSKLSEGLYTAATKIPVAGQLVEAGNLVATGAKTGLLTAGELTSIGVGGLRRAYGEFQAASGEAAIEAGSSFTEVYNHLYDDFMKEKGYEPNADEETRMRELAKSAAVDSYGLNMATLLVMNKLEFGNIMRNMIPDNAIARAFKNEALDSFTVAGRINGEQSARSFTRGTMGRFGIMPDVISTFDNGYRVAAAQFGKGLVSGFKQFSVWEGLQENIQEGIVHGLKKHYGDLYNNDPATWGESFQEAVDSQMNKQGLKTFMMGAMTGVVTGPLITRASKAIGYFGDREGHRTQKEETAKTVAAFNTFMETHKNVLSEHIRKTKEYNAYGEEMQRAAAADDTFNYLNSRESNLMQAVHSAKRLGNLPLLLDTIRAYGEGFDNVAFKEAFGFSPEDAGHSSAQEFTNRIAQDVERYSETYDHFMKKYSNFMDLGKHIKDPNRKLASDIARASLIDAIETVSFHESKAQDAVKRRAGIQSKIGSYQTIGDALQSGFDQLTNLSELENESRILQNEVQSLEALEVKNEDTQRLIKVKKEQLAALQDWTEAIGYTTDDAGNITYDNVEMRRKGSQTRYKASDAFKRYLGARNAGLKRSQVVKQEEVDTAMQDVVDFMELGEENRKMVDALNMLNDPAGFSKTFQAAQDARLGAHARNVANTVRVLATVDPAFARLLEENETLVRELEQFAEAPYANSLNYEYLRKLQDKLKVALKGKEQKENNPEDQKPKTPAQKTDAANLNTDAAGNTTVSPAALEPENLQMMLDLGKDAQAMEFVNRHYIFKQLAGNRYSFKRVVDSRVDKPIVTHEGEFDISTKDSFGFAVDYETALFNKKANGNPVDATLAKEQRKLKNVLGRTFKHGDNEAVLEEDDQGYYFRIYDPETGESIEEVDAGDDGNLTYTSLKANGIKFELIPNESDPQVNAGVATTAIPSNESGASFPTAIQELEDQKEEAIRDEKQKLQWHKGDRVMYEGEPGVIVENTDDATQYSIQLENGSVIVLGSADSLIDEYVGLSLAPQGIVTTAETVPVEDRVFKVEFTSDDRSTVTIDGKEFSIVRNENTGEISGLGYTDKKGPKVGRNGIYRQYINAINTTVAEMSDALAAEDPDQLTKDILDIEGNSKEMQTVAQITETVDAESYNKFMANEPLTPEEVESVRNSIVNALTLKRESEVDGALMDELEYALEYDLNNLNTKYPPDERPKNEPAAKNTKPRKAKRRAKEASEESAVDASAAPKKQTKNSRKSKSKPDSLQESIEQLEIQFEEAKADVRVQTENANITPVVPVEQYETTLDSLVTDLLQNPEELVRLVEFVESSPRTTKKSTKNRKFEVGSTYTQDDNNPFDSLGEGIFCKL